MGKRKLFRIKKDLVLVTKYPSREKGKEKKGKKGKKNCRSPLSNKKKKGGSFLTGQIGVSSYGRRGERGGKEREKGVHKRKSVVKRDHIFKIFLKSEEEGGRKKGKKKRGDYPRGPGHRHSN